MRCYEECQEQHAEREDHASRPASRSGQGRVSSVPAFAIVLLSTAGCAVMLGVTGVVYSTQPVSTQNESHERHVAIHVQASRYRSKLAADGVCESSFCEWNKDYILRAVDPSRDPCDDFYAHACNAQRWYRVGSRSTRPFAELGTAQLMTDMEGFFRYFVQLKGSPMEDNFLSRVMWVNEACQKSTAPRTNMTAELEVVFNNLGIVGGLPVRFVARGKLAELVAAGDRHLQLQPLFKVKVLRRQERGANGNFDIVLSAPDTLYRRFLTNFVDSTDSMYTDFVAKTLNLATPADTRSAARKIMQLEKRQESFALASADQLVMPPREKYASLHDLVLFDNWDWLLYFNTLIANANINNDTKVFVSDPIYFRNHGAILGGAWDAIIANYMAYKAIVELAPILGQDAEYLLQFSHSYEVPDLGERQTACLSLVEKLFRYGVGVAAKLTLGREFATTPRSYMDAQLKHLFNATRHLISGLVDSGRSWLDPLDKAIALRKLSNMRFEFGAQCNLVEYELYRRNHAALNSSNSLPLSDEVGSDNYTSHSWDQLPLPHVVFVFFSIASTTYWDAWGSATSRAYDNRYSLTAFRTGYELQHTGNLLIIPQATVAFLSQMSNVVHPVAYGVVAADLVRGLVEALTRSGSSMDADSQPRFWWSIATLDSYENISICLQSQYQAPVGQGARLRSLETDLLDNAVAYPLFQLYKESATNLGNASVTSAHGTEEAQRSLTMDQMFFYNFAAALCDFRDVDLWQQQRKFHLTPTPWRVNVPLKNLRAFADAFACKPGSPMNPAKRCSVWKEERSGGAT
ncbi:neprilysin-1 [Rhipicephalus microplus]|uniref:neprilysin-1 n=1 Tax=Rhipicephalus microplus TaxID=6941 RepID=UPI003F6AA30A